MSYHKVNQMVSQFADRYRGVALTSDDLRQIWYQLFPDQKPPQWSFYANDTYEVPLLERVAHGRYRMRSVEKIWSDYDLVRECMREYAGRRFSLPVLKSTLELELQMHSLSQEHIRDIVKHYKRFTAGDTRLPENVKSPIFECVGLDTYVILPQQEQVTAAPLVSKPKVTVTIECDLDQLDELSRILNNWNVKINR